MLKRLKAVWRPALFFLVCLAIALLINTPARLVLNQLQTPDNLKISRLQGTLFSGEVGELRIGQLPINQLVYRIDLSCLLTAAVCYQLAFEDGMVRIAFQPISQTISLSEVDAEFPVQQLAALGNQLLVRPSGSLRIESDVITMRQGKLVEIEALATWTAAGIIGEDFNLGDYQLEITKNAGLYRPILQDNDAVLDIDGEGKLSSDGNYSININIQARAGLDSRIKNALELVAQKKGLNQYFVRRSGQLDSMVLSFLLFEGNQ
jgi:hypothetical protein